MAESSYTGRIVEIEPEMVCLHEGKVLLDIWPVELSLSVDEARELSALLLAACVGYESANGLINKDEIEVRDARFPGAKEL